MKRFLFVRRVLCFCSFLSILLIIGAIGAWETENISFSLLLLQLVWFSLTGFLSAHFSRHFTRYLRFHRHIIAQVSLRRTKDLQPPEVFTHSSGVTDVSPHAVNL